MTKISKFLSLILLLLLMVGTAAAEEDQLNVLERAYMDYYAYDTRIDNLNNSTQSAIAVMPDSLEVVSGTDILATSGAELNITKTENEIIIDDSSEYNYIYDVAIPYADIEPFIRDGAVTMRHINNDGIVDAEWQQAVDNISGYAIFTDLPFSTVTVGFSFIPITISGSSPNGYQINVTIPYKTGMSSDFANIRFFAGNTSCWGGTEISYWVESYTADTSAYVWLPIPADATKVYCEWGISGETASESNIKAVMVFADDFSEGSLNTTLWTATASNGTRTFSNGIMQDSISSATEAMHSIITAKTDVNNASVVTVAKTRTTSSTITSSSRVGIKSSGTTIGAKLTL